MKNFNFHHLLLFLLILTLITKESYCFDNSDNYVHGPLTQESATEIKNTFDRIRNFLTINKMTENNFLSEAKTKKPNHHDNIICKGCLWLYDHTQKIILKKYGWSVLFEFVSLICSFGMSKEICFEYVPAYGNIVLESLIIHYMNPEFICTYSHMCKTAHFIKLNPDDYAKEILKDKPTNLTQPIVDVFAPVWKVLHITDIHLDLKYEEGSRGMCPKSLCCRNETKVGHVSEDQKAGKWGFLGKCDIPLRTLESFADKVFNEIKPDFVIWTGDNPGHDAYDRSAFDVATIFVDLIKVKYNYTLPVYPSLGNHEKYPADEYNPYDSSKEQAFLKMYGDLFKDWIGEDGYSTFLQFGGYSIKHPNSNLRIISSNCMLCDDLNFNLMENPTDPQNQIKWIQSQLKHAEENNEVVYFISHIPVGDVVFASECAKRYKALLERYSHLIRGYFFGHTHNDEIKIMTEYFNPNKTYGISYIAPSLTTYTFLNPSFRVFEIDSNTKLIRDYTQYRFNVTKANLNLNTKPDLDVAYKAASHLNVLYLNYTQHIYDYVHSLDDNQANFDKTVKMYFAEGPLYKPSVIPNNMSKYLKCRFANDVFENFVKCAGKKNISEEDYSYYILNWFSGSWYERLPN